MIQIAIVEDDLDLLDDLAFNVRQAGYAVEALPDGKALDAWLAGHEANILVLDLRLPGEDGLSIARRMRQAQPQMGLIILTARSTLDDRVQGLEQGADAYLAKPADLRELVAVIRNLACRIGIALPPPKHRTTWALKPSQLQLVAPGGQPISLSPGEFRVLQAAASAKSNLVSRKTLVEAMGYNYWHYDERRLETLISRLRRKLASATAEDFPVRGVKGHGYLFGVDLQEAAEEA